MVACSVRAHTRSESALVRSIPLYTTLPVAPIESALGLAIDHGCTRCVLGSQPKLKTVCMPADGEPGGLLVVGESPGRDEDQQGRPFIGVSGKLLRQALAKHWSGPIAFANAIACAPGSTIDKDKLEKPVEACRGYLAQTLREVTPKRIITLGSWAAYSVLGRSISMFGLRRSYSYLFDSVGDGESAPVPVFPVVHPAAALRNRFVKQWFDADLEWALTCPDPPKPPVDADCALVETLDDALFAIENLKRARRVAFDIEAAGIMYDPSYRVLCCALAPVETLGRNARCWVWGKQALADRATRAVLADYLHDDRYKKTAASGKYDCQGLRAAYGIEVLGLETDVRLERKLLEPEASGALEDMAELVGMGGHKQEAEDAIKTANAPIKQSLAAEKRCANYDAWLARNAADKAPPKPSKATREALNYMVELERREPELVKVIRKDPSEPKRYIYGLIEDDVLYRYCARDSVSTARLDLLLEPQIRAEPAFQHIWSEIVMPAARAIEHLERWGVPVDRTAVEQFDQYLAMKMLPIRDQLDQYGGTDFDADSPGQVRELLFGKLGLKPVGYTATTLESTDKDTLGVLAAEHPVAAAIVEWRRLGKLRSTYAGGMLDCLRADGRVHPSILLDGTRTGRPSAKDPNMFNAPRAKGSDEARMFRNCFIAGDGMVLLEVDFSQAELRKAAELSGDVEMIKLYEAGIDFHMQTARMISKTAWGVGPDDVTDEMRSKAKTVVFGLIYGQGDAALAAQIHTTQAQAKQIRHAILGKFVQLSRWIDSQVTFARKHGYVWTQWQGQNARRRPLWQIGDQDDARRVVAEHGSFNTPVQAGATEHNQAAMAAVVEWILSEGIERDCRLMLPIYDSLLLEVRESMVQEVAWQVRSMMLARAPKSVPFAADAKSGKSWGDMKPLEIV